MSALLNRRQWLAASAAGLAACQPGPPTGAPWPGQWVGANAERGHRWRDAQARPATPATGPVQRCAVLVMGGGIAGLACARRLVQQGVDDVRVIELEDSAGGNSRGHQMGGLACPLGAHYLPLPGPQDQEVLQLLHELGLARQHLGRTVFDERHLCHSPQERLFYQGAWHEGLLPPAEGSAGTGAQYQRFGQAVAKAQRDLGFAVPTARVPFTDAHRALDAITLAHWLAREGLGDERLRWYLDYCCRDDFGAPADQVSAWAGLHYFASRHGFGQGMEPSTGNDNPRDAVLTWPEGNAWLARRLAQGLGDRVLAGHTAWQLDEGRHVVQVLVRHEASGTLQTWVAQQVVLALPLMVATRLPRQVPVALRQAASTVRYAPWLVANLHLSGPLIERAGAPLAWDNVVYGKTSLGYVDALHQSLVPPEGATVLTAYHALAQTERRALWEQPHATWAQRVVADLADTHHDLPQQLLRVDLMRYGHAMRIPVPGARSDPALAALAQPQGRLHFAHADLSAYSVFEEAYSHGVRAAGQVLVLLRR
jgi:monoamine oxidase